MNFKSDKEIEAEHQEKIRLNTNAIVENCIKIQKLCDDTIRRQNAYIILGSCGVISAMIFLFLHVQYEMLNIGIVLGCIASGIPLILMGIHFRKIAVKQLTDHKNDFKEYFDKICKECNGQRFLYASKVVGMPWEKPIKIKCDGCGGTGRK